MLQSHARVSYSDQIDSNVVAVLGPTNTGKTHRAIERMLEHQSGIMGFPLRLLAQEVYERVCAKVGEPKVALLTGEERKIPKHARYWLCTVEAMPQDLEVEFLAVDEIQLATDRERGHVFTQRLLKARGSRETWFMGSQSMQRVIRTLIPHIRIERLTRLSTLSYGGRVSLSGLPARTAVVALSRKELYPIAEHIRQRKGGVALVLGALSPNARNAQVELFQSGKVDYLVATDAIGMGLNLDLSHVVFASLSKFDGQKRRQLATDELAQIAGRAGRYVQDGTFYTLHNGPQLDSNVIRDIEEHRFHSKTRLVWRNDELDFSGPEQLIASLRSAPAKGLFKKLQKADDFEALLWLCGRPALRPKLRSESNLRLLWTVCQIPDYRKLMLDRHFLLLEEIFLQLCNAQGQLSEAWLEKKLKDADNIQGGIEVLMTRLAFVRTWSYVTHRPGWLANAAQWQASARSVEEKLSAALHEALTIRFLERAAPGGKGSKDKGPRERGVRRPARDALSKKPEVEIDEHHPFAALSSRLAKAPQAEAETVPRHWLEQWISGDDRPLKFGGGLEIHWNEQCVARLGRGVGLLKPEIHLDAGVGEQVDAPERAELLGRLHAFVLKQIGRALLDSRILERRSSELSDAGRALKYALTLNAGISPWSELAPVWRRGCAHRLDGIIEGWIYVYSEASLGPEATEIRSKLIAASQTQEAERMPSWVAGLHRLGETELPIAELEQHLQRTLGKPIAGGDGRTVPDPGPPDALPETAWYRLLAGIGWTRSSTGELSYQLARDRNLFRPVRSKRSRGHHRRS